MSRYVAVAGMAAAALIGVTLGFLGSPHPLRAVPRMEPAGTRPALGSAPAPSTPAPSADAPPAAPSAPPAPPPPDGRRSRLVSADGSLDIAVGSYTDCSGAAPVPRDEADLDPCFLGRLYFVGHNPGVFTPLMHLGSGAVITYYDQRGSAQRFRVTAWRVIERNQGALTLPAGVSAQFQTCESVDGFTVRILDAVLDAG